MKKIIMSVIILGLVLASLGGCIIVPYHDGGGHYGHGGYRGDYYGHGGYRGRGDYYGYRR
jgi:hypothetical protein